LIKSEGRWYIGPDNGIFSEIIRENGTEEIFDIKTETDWWQAHTSFDGLALFSPAAAHLARGLSPHRFCKPITRSLTILPKPVPKIESRSLCGEIVMFDRFGNAQTNISKEHLDKIPQRSLLISCRQQTFSFRFDDQLVFQG
jgi:S-adenosylmethionine hydrolase